LGGAIHSGMGDEGSLTWYITLVLKKTSGSSGERSPRSRNHQWEDRGALVSEKGGGTTP